MGARTVLAIGCALATWVGTIPRAVHGAPPAPTLGVLFKSGMAGEALFFSSGDRLEELLALRKEGKLSAATVVLPVETPFREDELPSWNAHVARVSPGTENAFVFRAGAFVGNVEGLAVRIVPAREWREPAPSGPVILDLAFLLAGFQDESRTPFVSIPRNYAAFLEERKVDPSRVAIWVEERGAIPLERGYLPELAAAVLRDPASFRRGLPPKWQALQLGEYMAYLGFGEQAVAHLEAYLKEDPAEPSVLYRIALLRLVDRETDRALRYLHRAFEADPFYIRGYAAAAFVLYRKGEFDDAERILRAGLHLVPDFPDLKAGMGRTLVAEAARMFPRDPTGAEKRYGEIAALELPPELGRKIAAEWEAAKVAAPPFPGDIPAGHGPGGHGR